MGRLNLNLEFTSRFRNNFTDCPVGKQWRFQSGFSHTAVYECDDGFTLYPETADHLHCTLDGKWKIGTQAICHSQILKFL